MRANGEPLPFSEPTHLTGVRIQPVFRVEAPENQKKIVKAIAEEVLVMAGPKKQKCMIGTLIEIPRSALAADLVAREGSSEANRTAWFRSVVQTRGAARSQRVGRPCVLPSCWLAPSEADVREAFAAAESVLSLVREQIPALD